MTLTFWVVAADAPEFLAGASVKMCSPNSNFYAGTTLMQVQGSESEFKFEVTPEGVTWVKRVPASR